MKKLSVMLALVLVVTFGSSVFSSPGAHTASNKSGSEVARPVNNLGLSSPVVASAPMPVEGTTVEGDAALQPQNRSGIRALVHVQTIGRTNTVTGLATGMDPHKAYISVFYDTGSVAEGPCACVRTTPSPMPDVCKTTNAQPLTFGQMVIGYWLPLIGSSTRTLHVLKFAAPDAPAPLPFVPLEIIGTVSVREDTQLGAPLPTAPDPVRFQLRACGKFRINR